MSARINYPGEICTAIYDAIASRPVVFDLSWKFFFVTCISSLLLSTFFNERWRLSGAQSNRLNWLVSDRLFILISCLGIFLLRLPNLILPEQCYDESVWIINAAVCNQNAVLWKDIDGGTSGPFVFLPLNVAYLFGDGLNFSNIRLFGLLGCVIPSFFLAWKTLLMLYGSMTARLVMLPLFILFASANHSDMIAYNGEHVPMLLLALCIYLFYSLLTSSRYVISKLALLGLVLGAVPFSKLQAVPLAVCIGCITIYNIISFAQPLKPKITGLAVLIGTSLICTGIILLYLLLNDALYDFWLKYFQMNWIYAKSGILAGPPPLTGWSRLLLFPYFILRAHGHVNLDILPFVTAELLLVCVTIFFALKKINSSVLFNKKCIQAFIIMVFAIFSVISPGNKFLHYLILFIIPFSVFIGILHGEILSRAKFDARLAFITLICALIGAIAIPSGFKTNRGIEYASSGMGYPLREECKIIRQYTNPNEKMTVWGSAFYYYVETGLFTKGLTDIYFAMGLPKENNIFIDRFIKKFKSEMPVVFFDIVTPSGFLFNEKKFQHDNFPDLHEIISKEYTLVADVSGKRIFVLNSRVNERKARGI